MFRKLPTGLRASGACIALLALAIAYPATPGALSSSVVISQVYGGGGNTFNRDFVELFNRGTAPVSLTGMTVQYASATGTGNFGGNAFATLSGTLGPGQYYLVGFATAGTTNPLPVTADAAASTNLSASSGKVALVNSTTGLLCNGGSTACSPAQLAQIVDLVGYGSANFFEGAPAPAASNTTAILRTDFGCTETDNNSTDFAAGTPAPRNSASGVHPCGATQPVLTINDVTVNEGDSGSTTATFTVNLSATSASAVTFNIATADDSAMVGDGDYVANSLAGQVIPAGTQTYSFEVAVHGDTTVEPNESFFVNLSGVTGALVGDGQGVGTIVNDDVAIVTYDVVISQVYGGGGNSGAFYTNDFIELFNRGTTTVSLAGWSVAYNSPTSTTSAWQVAPLSGSIAPGRYFLVQLAAQGGGTTPLPPSDATGAFNLGGTNGKVVLRSSNTPISAQCLAGGDVVDLVGYGSANCAEAAPTSALSNTTAALRKRGGCYDSNNNAEDFSIAGPTPRNSASPARACEYTTLAIHDIQGAGATTPYFGLDVTTTGIVTGLKTNGMFVQSTTADADPATSEGIFVFTGSAPAATVGADVLVKGTATEYFNLTQIESSLPGDVMVVTPGNPAPAPVLLTPAILSTTGTADQLERFEGMRVQTGTLTSVSPSDGFGEVYTVLASVARPMREIGAPASEFPLPADPGTGSPDCCVDKWDENPERLVIDTDGLVGSTRLYLTSNVTISGVTGPLDYTFGAYKLLPEATPSVSPNMSAVPVPAPAANEFAIAGYNIENFTGDVTQRRKAALNIRTSLRSPDIIGLIEIFNLATLESLATQVNADAVEAGEPDPAYQARLIPAPAGGTQHVGFLVKTSRVYIHDVWQYEGDVLFTPTSYLHDRPPLVLDATIDPGGVNPGRVLVVVNHPRSFIDVELNNAEGARVRAKRTAQAESIARLLQQLQADTPNTPVIAVGDYNAYEFSDGYTDPISVITGNPTPGDHIVETGSPDLVTPNFINLTNTLPADQRYSFVFEGTPQALDHVLINEVAQRYFQRYAISHSNADFPESLAGGFVGDATRPERNSDHDQPVAYFAFPGTPVVTLNGSATMNVEAFTSFTDPGATAHDDVGPLPVTVGGDTVDVNVPGTYTISYTATNLYQSTTVTRTVIVADTTAPAISGFSVSPTSLGPPNHKLHDVTAPYSVADASGTSTCSIGVTSNEPINGLGDGNTSYDWLIVDAHHLRLRAERSGLGSGRLYTITLTCSDASGNASSATATVSVRK